MEKSKDIVSSVNTNNLKFFKNRPFFSKIDYSDALVSEMAPVMDKYIKDTEVKHPEEAALEFYFLNHCYSEICKKMYPEEDLGDFRHFVYLYNEVGSLCAIRMFYYILMICMRESRHVKFSSVYDQVREKFQDDDMTNFLKSIKGQGIKTMLWIPYHWDEKKNIVGTPLNLYFSLGNLVDGLEMVFRKGKFSKNFGGKKWADIAKILSKFVHGEISAEVFLDTSFALMHNTGPIFNKGILYHAQDTNKLLCILDAQRAGYIPQLINEKRVDSFVSMWLNNVKKQADEIFGDQIMGGFVDWYQVEALGAVGSYSYYKKKQVSGEAMTDSDFLESIIKNNPVGVKSDENYYVIIPHKVFFEKISRENING